MMTKPDSQPTESSRTGPAGPEGSSQKTVHPPSQASSQDITANRSLEEYLEDDTLFYLELLLLD